MYSERYKKIINKKEKERWLAKLNSAAVQNAENVTESEANHMHENVAPSFSENSGFNVENEDENRTIRDFSAFNIENDENRTINARQKLINELGQWQLDSRISNNNMRKLLKILRNNDIDVPLSPATLVPKVTVNREVLLVQPGQYMHLGIAQNLKKAGHIISHYDSILCDINVDGLPVFNSSNIQLWPILLRIINVPNINVFPVGIYLGKKKPENIESYLAPFIDEISQFQKHGLIINGKKIDFKIRAIICDAPAKSFVCGIPHHSSANGCSKCTQIGKKISHKLVYSTEPGEIMNDVDFHSRRFKNQHQLNFQNKATPLEIINIQMISQVPLDPMHVIDLGVTRKILKLIYKNKLEKKMSQNDIKSISNSLVNMKKHIANEFSRLPRGLDELCHWKATEFRQFLLYTGVIVLKDFVSDDLYYTFLLLHCAVRLLSCPINFRNNIQSADNLLNYFVNNFGIIFKQENLSYNVHALLHISACVKEHGHLYNFSAYAFENKLQMIKKDIRKPTNILQQLYIRNIREKIIADDIEVGIKEKTNIIHKFSTENFTLTTKYPNNVCLLMPYTPFKISRFMKDQNNEIFIIGRSYKHIRSFFDKPVDSLSALGISVAETTLDEEEETISVENIYCKLMSLPYNSNIIFLPILHGCT